MCLPAVVGTYCVVDKNESMRRRRRASKRVNDGTERAKMKRAASESLSIFEGICW